MITKQEYKKPTKFCDNCQKTRSCDLFELIQNNPNNSLDVMVESIFKELKNKGYDNERIINLSIKLLDLVIKEDSFDSLIQRVI